MIERVENVLDSRRHRGRGNDNEEGSLTASGRPFCLGLSDAKPKREKEPRAQKSEHSRASEAGGVRSGAWPSIDLSKRNLAALRHRESALPEMRLAGRQRRMPSLWQAANKRVAVSMAATGAPNLGRRSTRFIEPNDVKL
jgi:hypothetical protein